MAETYRIIDEPSPSALSKWAVDPFWPFLAVMLGGAGIGVGWFVLNALALGGSTRAKELLLCATALLGGMALSFAGLKLVHDEVIAVEQLAYWATVLIVFKLGVAYFLHLSQARSAQLFVHFGGHLKSGMLVLVAAIFLRSYWVNPLPDFWILVLG